MRGKDAGLAVVLSILMPGLGQVYNEQYLKGFIVFILFLILLFTTIIGGIVIWILAAYDAHSTAK